MTCDILKRALRDKRLTRTDLAILGELIEDRDTYPTRRQIADAAGCAPSSVPRSARKLEELGYVSRVIDKRDHGGRAKPTRYVLAADTYQSGYVSNEVRSAAGTLDVAVRTPEQPENLPPRISPDTGQIPPKENNQTPQEFYPERSELVEGVVVVAANSDRPPPPAWQRVLDAVRSPWLDENKFSRLILEGAIVQRWLDAGADEHLDVIPTVRRLIDTKRDHVPWNYFTKAVRETTARRLAAEASQTTITPAEATHDIPRTRDADPGVRRRQRSPLTERARQLMSEREPDEFGRVDSFAGK